MGKTYVAGETLTAADLNASLSEAVNTTGYFVFTGEHVHNANLTSNTNFFSNSLSYFSGNSTFYANVTLGTSAILSSSNTISDRIGNVRQVPMNPVGSGYTLVALDSGKVVYNGAGGTMTVPFGIFVGGDTITIYNSGPAFTIVQGGGGTLYWAGQPSVTTGSRTLATAGLCTVLFINPTYAVITGAGLT
jgi:hypothetical protein